MNRLHLLIIFFAVLLIAAYSSWLLTTFRTDVLTDAEVVRHDPDYYLEGVNATVLNIPGNPRYHLTAEKVLHYPDDGSVELIQPHLRIFNEKRSREKPWEIDAERGIVLNKGETINLLGKVEMYQPASGKRASSKLLTRDLTILPQHSFAKTEARADIDHASHHLAGVGMQVFFEQGRLEILSKGKGIYVVQP